MLTMRALALLVLDRCLYPPQGSSGFWLFNLLLCVLTVYLVLLGSDCLFGSSDLIWLRSSSDGLSQSAGFGVSEPLGFYFEASADFPAPSRYRRCTLTSPTRSLGHSIRSP